MIKRYDFKIDILENSQYLIGKSEQPDGAMVYFTDHQAEIERLTEKFSGCGHYKLGNDAGEKSGPDDCVICALQKYGNETFADWQKLKAEIAKLLDLLKRVRPHCFDFPVDICAEIDAILAQKNSTE